MEGVHEPGSAPFHPITKRERVCKRKLQADLSNVLDVLELVLRADLPFFP